MRSPLLPRLVLCAALAAHGASAADFAFTRSSTNDAPDEASVTLAITFVGTGVCHAVEERLPGTLTVAGAPSSAGVVLADGRTLRWGPFDLVASTTLTYRIAGRAGSHPIEGNVWMDGHAVFALTGTSVTVGAALPAPATTPPAQVAMPTLNPPGATMLPVDVTVSCATEGAALRYTLDGSVPTASSALVEGAITISSDTLLSVRGFKDGMTSSRAGYGLYATPPQRSEDLIQVSREILIADCATPLIAVTATVLSGDTISYSVAETVALGLTPSAIAESGVWDDGARVIRWGPFDDGQSRTLTYRVGNIGVNNRAYPLDGTASVNGLPAAISGAEQVEPLAGPSGSPDAPQPPHEATDVSRAAELSWTNPPDAIYNALYLSTNEAAVATMDVAARVRYDGTTLGSAYRPATPLTYRTRYYWRVAEFDAQGEFSAGPVWSFTVKRSDTGMILSEGFEHGGAMPPGWTQELASGSRTWIFQNGGYNSQAAAAAHSGSYNAMLYHSAAAHTRLITPPLNLTSGHMRLSFWHAQASWLNGAYVGLYVYYKTSPDGAWTLIPGASFTSNVSGWTKRVFDLPGNSATYYIAFYGVTFYGVNCIDDVDVYPALAAQGTPHGWLSQYNLTDGGLTFDEAEALDSDGDAFFNWQEFIAGTDPTNSASAFRILGLDLGPPATVIFEPSTPDRDYTLQATTNLVVGPWADVPGQGPRMGGEGEDAMEDDGAATPTRFYRVKVQVP